MAVLGTPQLRLLDPAAVEHVNGSPSAEPLDQFSRVTGRRSGSLGGGAQACVSSCRLA